MKGSGNFQVILYLLFSMHIVISVVPFKNEVRGERVEESSLNMPPFVPPKREETGTNSEEEENEEADNEFSEKRGHELGEEFFKRLERELAMETAKNDEEGNYSEELLKREEPEEYEEMPEEYTKDDSYDGVEKELNILRNGELEKSLEENGLTGEERKREFGQRNAEGLRSPEEIDSRGMEEESEEKSDGEVREETTEENMDNEREADEDENEENEDDYPKELFGESEEKFKKELKNNEELEENVEDAGKSARSFMDERKEDIHEGGRLATPRENMLIRMLSYPRERLSTEWNEKPEDDRLRGLGEELHNEAEERPGPKHLREREAERERERFDRYGNEERELEMLRERQRERAIGEGLRIREKEMEGRKQREEKDPFGVSRQQREKFRFRSRSE